MRRWRVCPCVRNCARHTHPPPGTPTSSSFSFPPRPQAVARYYLNNFSDGVKQDAIDLLTGGF